jgi:transcriptional regulator with XRE-family HTH domain
VTPTQLAAAREALHLSQAELARQLGVAANTVNRWERGTREIPPYLRLALVGIKAMSQAKTVFCPECSEVHSRLDPACPIVRGTLRDDAA